MRIPCLALGLVVALGLFAPAAQGQTRLETNSGRVYQGEVVSDDGTSIELAWESGSIKLPYAQLTLKTRYHLRRDKAGADSDSQADLADWCVDMTLYREAQRHYRDALDADALKAESINKRVAAARKKAGKELLARAKSLAESNQLDDARHVLSIIVQELPLESVAAEAASLLAEDTARRKASTFVRAPATSGADAVPESERAKRRNGEDFSDAARATFADVVKAYHSMLDSTQKGLVTSNQSSAIKEFERALKDGEKVRKEADKLRPQGPEDAEIAEALELVDSKLEEAVVSCRIHLADAYLLRSSYNQAAEAVNQGLAEYPQSARLAQAKERVTSAASYDGGGGWLIRGRGRR